MPARNVHSYVYNILSHKDHIALLVKAVVIRIPIVVINWKTQQIDVFALICWVYLLTLTKSDNIKH